MSVQKIDIQPIDARAELERLEVPFEQAGPDEIKLCCPIHGDEHPSLFLNVNKNVYKCQTAGCGAKGDIVTLLGLLTGCERHAVIEDLKTRYAIVDEKTIKPDRVERHHAAIWSHSQLLQELYDRGITDEMIRKARLGEHEGRITIPVYDIRGRVVNIRSYLPGAPGDQKMRNAKGHSEPRLYQLDQVAKYPSIVICGGEMKALLASSLLSAYNIGAVAVTAGEGAWEVQWNKLFKGKTVYICMDIDRGGRAAAERVARKLSLDVSDVRIVTLPLDPEKHPKGDINDWVGKEGATAEQFYELLQAAKRYERPLDAEEELEVVEVKLNDAASAANMGKRVSFEATVSALDDTPYLVPKVVSASCTRDQPQCDVCPVRCMEPDDKGLVELRIKGTSVGLLDMVNSARKFQRDGIRNALKIPKCKTVEFTVKEHYNIWDARLTPQLTISGQNRDHVIQPAMLVDCDDLEMNVPYIMTGRVHPHPRNQQAMLVLDDIQQAEDSLDAFSPTSRQLEELDVFSQGDGISDRLSAIYEDIEANVTRIYKRRGLHLLLDLTYHSPLYFYFDGRIQKGWVNSLVIGDSSQGKSETALRLIEHYGLGERVECKNASTAGLLGGLQQMGTRWFVSWGVIPQHDRRLVVLEEVKGASTEVLGRLTDMRSSGIAEIPKIEKRRAHARTRLIFISNPRTDRPISAYNFGIEAIKELIGGLEDIRRFDIASVVAASQVDPGEINRLSANRPTVPHTFTADLCRRLVLWCWTRTPNQIRFTPEAETACLKHASELCSKFTDSFPLLDRGTTRFKLARLAAALAGRLFSHPPDDYQTLLVTEEHVAYIREFIEKLYTSPHFGYADYSRAQEYSEKLLDEEQVANTILGSKFAKDLVEHLLHADEVTFVDIGDWCDLNREDAKSLLSFLVRKHALRRVKRWYVKTTGFIELLKRIRPLAQQSQKINEGAEF